VRGRPLRWGALIAIVAAALPGCDDGRPAQRGFGSYQLAQFRDPTFRFYSSKGDLVFYETGRDDTGGGEATYWSVDLGTGEFRNLGSTMPDLGTTNTNRYKCEYSFSPEGRRDGYMITDTQTGQLTVIEHVSFTSPYCPANDDPMLIAWRIEPDGTYTLWTGPFYYLVQATLPVVVHQILWREVGTTLVAAPSADTPDGLGVYAIADRDPTVATEVLPPTLSSAAWAAGATPSTSLMSSGLFGPLAVLDSSFFWAAMPGRYTYARAMADGSQVMFAGPYEDGAARELALFPILPNSQLMWLRIEPYHYRYDGRWLLSSTWSSVEGAEATATFRIYRDATRRLATCTWPGDQYPIARGDPADENALFVEPEVGSGMTDRPLLLMVPDAPDGNTCRTLATTDVGYADFSPDGTAMVWLIEPPDFGKATLWTAGRDGSAPRTLGTGYIDGALYTSTLAPHFVGGSQLELTLEGDLIWIDVHDDPARSHYITEQVFGAAVDLGRWVVTGHDYSDQDATGELAMVNRDSGETRPISPAVWRYMSPDARTRPSRAAGTFEDDGSPVRIVYVVRGRNPSAQDGLWVATITGQDRQ
jgi:hypothetical protein